MGFCAASAVCAWSQLNQDCITCRCVSVIELIDGSIRDPFKAENQLGAEKARKLSFTYVCGMCWRR